MDQTAPVNYFNLRSDLFSLFEKAMGVIADSGLDKLLSHLVMLRASQINGCAYCVNMHTREARQDNETNERLDEVIVWRHSSHFSDKEKAALAWTEALTNPDGTKSFGSLRADLRQHYSDEDITALTGLVGMINLWNRVQISNY